MATQYAYSTNLSGLTQLLDQLRKRFPQKVNADTLKSLKIAPSNEASVLSVIKFLGLIDEEGKKTDSGATAFSESDDVKFADQFSRIIVEKYEQLSDLHGDGMWTLPRVDLISFFRTSDKTSDQVGSKQAQTFEVLAAYVRRRPDAKSGQIPKSSKDKTPRNKLKGKGKTASNDLESDAENSTRTRESMSTPIDPKREFSLTVRIEINLPVTEEKEVYDRIFKSLRENLLNE